jgi:hypothetical protein
MPSDRHEVREARRQLPRHDEARDDPTVPQNGVLRQSLEQRRQELAELERAHERRLDEVRIREDGLREAEMKNDEALAEIASREADVRRLVAEQQSDLAAIEQARKLVKLRLPLVGDIARKVEAFLPKNHLPEVTKERPVRQEFFDSVERTGILYAETDDDFQSQLIQYAGRFVSDHGDDGKGFMRSVELDENGWRSTFEDRVLEAALRHVEECEYDLGKWRNKEQSGSTDNAAIRAELVNLRRSPSLAHAMAIGSEEEFRSRVVSLFRKKVLSIAARNFTGTPEEHDKGFLDRCEAMGIPRGGEVGDAE